MMAFDWVLRFEVISMSEAYYSSKAVPETVSCDVIGQGCIPSKLDGCDWRRGTTRLLRHQRGAGISVKAVLLLTPYASVGRGVAIEDQLRSKPAPIRVFYRLSPSKQESLKIPLVLCLRPRAGL
jgi:hypothetical protein